MQSSLRHRLLTALLLTIAALASTQQELPAPELPYRPQFPDTCPVIGLIGCGGITEQHLTAYRNAGLNVVALCDINEDNAKAKAA